ncbi:MAG: type II toxin-antitoxin system Phd/YefM family antitoxin [Holophagales bacterium]|nr:MAG: type II toxin-antitoxin system Phd/YefM family antitoxin [Holophagales bacterium]
MRAFNVEEDIRPLSEFRADAAGLLARVRRTKRALVLTQRGHTSAVVLDPAEYQRLVDELDLLRDIHAASRELESGEGVSHRAAKARALARLEG